MTSITAPAHPHATGVAVYPAFVFSLAYLKQRVTMIELPLKRVNGEFMFSFLVPSLSLFVSLYVCQSVCVSGSFCWPDFLSVCLSASLSFCQSVLPPVCLSASLSFFQSVFLSFCQSFFLSVSLSFGLSVFFVSLYYCQAVILSVFLYDTCMRS